MSILFHFNIIFHELHNNNIELYIFYAQYLLNVKWDNNVIYIFLTRKKQIISYQNL